jgi:hypothetical protein
MLQFLKTLLQTNMHKAPVRVAFDGSRTDDAFILTAVDEIGVVIENEQTGNVRIAVPWTAIKSIAPNY